MPNSISNAKIVIVILNQGVHSVKLIFSGALDKHTIQIHTTNRYAKTNMHTKHITKETKTKLQLREREPSL